MKILFVHLLNNYTGSPKVLSIVLRHFSKCKNYECSLLTSNTEGFLTGIENIQYCYNGYSWSDNKILLSFKLLFAQIKSFFKVLFFKKVDVVYVNTMIPFGAAIAAKFRRFPIVYDSHEVYTNPNVMHRFCLYVMKKTASKIICVSDFVKESFKLNNAETIYNCVPEISNKENNSDYRQKFLAKTILMPTSLKVYQGVLQFVELAKLMPDYKFCLVCSAAKEEIDAFFNTDTPQNLNIYPRQDDMTPFYKAASVVVNFSLPDKWQETFGMTLIEGMQYGCAVIAPDAGGPKEIVDNGQNGFLVNPYDLNSVKSCIESIFQSEENYKKFSDDALNKVKEFSFEKFISGIEKILQETGAVYEIL